MHRHQMIHKRLIINFLTILPLSLSLFSFSRSINRMAFCCCDCCYSSINLFPICWAFDKLKYLHTCFFLAFFSFQKKITTYISLFAFCIWFFFFSLQNRFLLHIRELLQWWIWGLLVRLHSLIHSLTYTHTHTRFRLYAFLFPVCLLNLAFKKWKTKLN